MRHSMKQFSVGSRSGAQRRGRITFAVATLAASSLLVAGCGGGAASDSELTARWAWSLPGDSPSSEATVKAVDAIEESSDGGISIDTYPNSTLVDQTQSIEAVQNGSIDLATASLARFASLDPALAVDGIPGLIAKPDQAVNAVNGEFGEVADDLVSEYGVKIVGWTVYGRASELINTERPIETLEDLKGLRMRANGALWGAIYNKFDAQGFEMSSGDVYTSLQSNTLDGAFSGINSILERDWAEVAPYITAGVGSLVLYPVIANLDWWNDLSSKQQELISGAVKDASVDNFDQIDKRYKEDLATVREKHPDVKILVVEGDLEKQWLDDLAFVEGLYLEDAGANGKKLIEAYAKATK